MTEEQLEELWRLAPTPILCFDGDAAGSRAVARAADLALPLLTPDRSLKLARLPAGEDPDSLVRRRGIEYLPPSTAVQCSIASSPVARRVSVRSA